MNEQTLYSEMLEIPVNTCSITYTSKKRRNARKTKKHDDVKDQVLEKVNGELAAEEAASAEQTSVPQEETDTAEAEAPAESTVNIVRKKKRGFPIIGTQIAVICLLLGLIIFSNLYTDNTGISAFFNTVFARQTIKTDTREYNSFAANLPIEGEVTVENGVMTFSSKGSVYAPCEGTITAISETDGKFTVEVTHSTRFKTVIKGIDYAYQELGSTVYGNVPLGYSLGENVELCFYAQDAMITDYTVDGDAIVWAV